MFHSGKAADNNLSCERTGRKLTVDEKVAIQHGELKQSLDIWPERFGQKWRFADLSSEDTKDFCDRNQYKLPQPKHAHFAERGNLEPQPGTTLV